MTSDTSDTSAAGSPPDTANNNSATPANRGSGASDKIKMKKKTQRSDSTATVDSNPPAKVTKRRAARACVSCRARKVRCNVVEESPCTNCRFDNVEVCPGIWAC